MVTLVFYILISTQYGSHKIRSSFYSDVKSIIPTTSHTEDIDLKNVDQVYHEVDDNSCHNLRLALSKQFPYDADSPIPRKVWQTWKTERSSSRFPPNFKKHSNEWMNACQGVTPPYQYQLITDDQMLPLLKQVYGGVPEIVQAFESLPLPILKADFFRYLIVYARGGIYSDMDTFPLKSLNTWPSVDRDYLSKFKDPIKYKNSSPNIENREPMEPGFVIGIEADPDRADWAEWYARRIQFCQWTIQSKPGHPLLRELIINITATTLHSVSSVKSTLPLVDFKIEKEHEHDFNVNMRDRRRLDTKYKHDEKKNAKNTDGTDIMNWTGPGIFSDIVFEYLNNIIRHNQDVLIFNSNLKREQSQNPDEPGTRKFYKEISSSLSQLEPKFHWGFFSLMEVPVLVEDILVLPITGFSPDVGQMGSKSMDDEMAFVKHMFEGSWKDEDTFAH